MKREATVKLRRYHRLPCGKAVKERFVKRTHTIRHPAVGTGPSLDDKSTITILAVLLKACKNETRCGRVLLRSVYPKNEGAIAGEVLGHVHDPVAAASRCHGHPGRHACVRAHPARGRV